MAELGKRPRPRNKPAKDTRRFLHKTGVLHESKDAGQKSNKPGMPLASRDFAAAHTEQASSFFSPFAGNETAMIEDSNLEECREAWLKIADEDTLRRLWDTPEEDEAWRDLLKEM